MAATFGGYTSVCMRVMCPANGPPAVAWAVMCRDVLCDATADAGRKTERFSEEGKTCFHQGLK